MAGSTRPVQAPRQRGGGPAKRPPAPGARRAASRRRLYLGALGVAALCAVTLIVASLVSGNGGKGSATGGTVTGKLATAALLKGIPQRGTTLGSPTAPYKLVEYADFQCPYCGIWARDVFPAVVRDYVRPGNVQVEFRGLVIVGPDSETALKTALGSAPQNRFWNVDDLLYRNQGTENTGWVTEPLLASILGSVPGLDVARATAASKGPAVAARIDTSARLASLDGVSGTPTFMFGPVGGTMQPLDVGSLDVSSFRAAIDAAMNG